MGSIVKTYGKILGKSPFPHHKYKSKLIGKGFDEGNVPGPPSTIPEPNFDPNEMLKMFAGLMSSMSPPEAPDPPILPEVYREPEVDWTDRKKQLSKKAKADYLDDQIGKKGVTDTVHTSPLLDEGDVDTTGSSILTGSIT